MTKKKNHFDRVKEKVEITKKIRSQIDEEIADDIISDFRNNDEVK